MVAMLDVRQDFRRDGLRWLSNGPPGTACISKNDTVNTTQSVMHHPQQPLGDKPDQRNPSAVQVAIARLDIDPYSRQADACPARFR